MALIRKPQLLVLFGVVLMTSCATTESGRITSRKVASDGSSDSDSSLKHGDADLGPYFDELFKNDRNNQTPIQSKIKFSDSQPQSKVYDFLHPKNFDAFFDPKIGQETVNASHQISMADISVPDPLKACPIDDVSPDLAAMVDQLVLTVQVNLNNVKATEDSENCQSLAQHLTNSRAQLAGLLASEIAPDQQAGSSASTSTTATAAGATGTVTGTTKTTSSTTTTTVTAPSAQDLVNATVRRQAAVNEIVTTAGDIIQNNCISSSTDRATIQKIAGQTLSVAGNLVGGWAGVVVAIAGQIVGDVNLDKIDMDKAMDGFRKYENLTSEGSFLCSYREMQKTTCLLFSPPTQNVVGGLDTTFASGATKLTADTVQKNVNDSLLLHEEMRFLKLVSDVHGSNLDDSIEHLGQFCGADNWKYFKPEDMFSVTSGHPAPIQAAFSNINLHCNDLRIFKYPSSDEEKKYISNLQDSFKALNDYYNYNKSTNTLLGIYAASWESLKYFDDFIAKIKSVRDPEGGSQFKINFQGLVKALDKSMVVNSFNALFAHNEVVLKDKTNGPSVKSKAFEALLDLCETFDPTLTCLYPDKDAYSVEKAWEYSCVGPQSKLCQAGGAELLNGDANYLTYYQSLCPAGK